MTQLGLDANHLQKKITADGKNLLKLNLVLSSACRKLSLLALRTGVFDQLCIIKHNFLVPSIWMHDFGSTQVTQSPQPVLPVK